ncbi:helix-turn-helix domain-containing protein [Pasteurella multocida]|uniref:hypothetical protein n=1 Tax=Pasteurella multocida TaxID=747 RepID=UPI003979AD85
MTLISQTKQFLTDTGTTQAKLAKEAGINSGALSAYLNENYKGNVAEIEAKLTAYFGRQAT